MTALIQDRTTSWYNENAEAFETGSEACSTDEDIISFLSQITGGLKILDLGCGTGRDAKLIHEYGFSVKAIDLSEEMCRIARAKGLDVDQAGVSDSQSYKDFNGIWCLAVLVHMPTHLWMQAIRGISNMLAFDGLAHIWVKEGDFCGVDHIGRPLYEITERGLANIVSLIPNVDCKITRKAAPTSFGETKTWLNLQIKKTGS